MKITINSIITSLTLALTVQALSSCQEEEFGYTKSEIYQTYIERKYAEEFHKAFPNVDPEQTWMCLPDTIDAETLSNQNNGDTRSVSAISKPVKTNETLQKNYTEISAALNFMKEAENNSGKCAQNFEYLAVNETTYDIYPIFWGRKFCANNSVGVYYIDASGNKRDLGTFWSDVYNNIKVHFKDGSEVDMTNSTSPITDIPGEKYNENFKLRHVCSKCKGGNKAKCTRCSNGKYYDNNKWITCVLCEGTGYVYTGGTGCTYCGDKGYAEVDYYLLPKYTLTMPKGTKWGLYLKTYKTQSTTNTVNWYSNANYNVDTSKDNNYYAKAAATFTYDNVTYCSFEDAPYRLSSCTSNTGTCNNCGHGHYDTDYNDIVLTITPRPIETTYKAVSYRVMCEDLGGVFDWDFNDVVYDVVYEEGKNSDSKATITYILQAVGGTLPVKMSIDGTETAELHEAISNQTASKDKLYKPVNVGGTSNAVPADATPLQKITLAKKTYSEEELDVRDYVHQVSIKVTQANGTTTDVKFPYKDSSTDSTPQCFMTSTGTEWTNEEQNICDKYPLFQSWVAKYTAASEWWKETF